VRKSLKPTSRSQKSTKEPNTKQSEQFSEALHLLRNLNERVSALEAPSKSATIAAAAPAAAVYCKFEYLSNRY
jgi:hypothetical protein